MSRYDFSKCTPEALNAFFAEYGSFKVTQYGWQEYQVLLAQAKVKTRVEYDREIADIVRQNTPNNFKEPVIEYWNWEVFAKLVQDSKEAPEE